MDKKLVPKSLVFMLAVLALAILACGGGKAADYKGPYAYMHGEYKLALQGKKFTTVWLMRTHGEEECETRRAKEGRSIVDGLMAGCEECEVTGETRCMEEPPPLYSEIFENQPLHQTYISANPKRSDERAERMIIFGIPTRVALDICKDAIRAIGKTYRGPLRCVEAR